MSEFHQPPPSIQSVRSPICNALIIESHLNQRSQWLLHLSVLNLSNTQVTF